MIVIDDYAHHPTEIEATLDAAAKGWPNRRVVAVFQPHLYSRTRDFQDAFARAFYDADVLVLTEIYGAREEPIDGVSGRMLADLTSRYGHRDVRFVPEKADVPEYLQKVVRSGDLVSRWARATSGRVAKRSSLRSKRGRAERWHATRNKQQRRRRLVRRTLAVLGLGAVVALGVVGWRWQASVPVRAVTVSGVVHADTSAVLDLAAVPDSAMLFSLDPAILADRVRRHPWVAGGQRHAVDDGHARHRRDGAGAGRARARRRRAGEPTSSTRRAS